MTPNIAQIGLLHSRGESPKGTVEVNQAPSFEVLLSHSHKVLPLLAKMNSLNDSIFGVVAKIRMQALNQRMHLHGSHRFLCQQIEYRVRKDRVSCLSFCSQS